MIDVAASVAACERQTYCGMTKTAEDAARYERVITQYRPEVILECGTYIGMSALWFAQFAPVITVDIGAAVQPSTLEAAGDRVTWLTDRSSVDPDVIAEVVKAIDGRRVLVSLDSDHSPRHVLAEMNAYAPMVPVGGWMVVEDGIVRQWWGMPGPLDALEAWLPDHPEWLPDKEIEDMSPVTLFPSGWLRRMA